MIFMCSYLSILPEKRIGLSKLTLIKGRSDRISVNVRDSSGGNIPDLMSGLPGLKGSDITSLSDTFQLESKASLDK